MSDMRFIILGIVLIFVGFIILGTFGHEYQAATLEADEFGTCYEYFEDKPPSKINCSFKIMDQTVFFWIDFIICYIRNNFTNQRRTWRLGQ